MTILPKERVHTRTYTQTNGKSWIKRTHSSWWKTQLWLIWWRSTCMLRENLRWEIPFQICPHSCTKTPFKACSTTLGWIYGAATFYPKCSDFSTKSFSPSSQRPPGSPLSPSRNNSSDRKKGKCLVQLFQFWFQVFRFLYCEPLCTRDGHAVADPCGSCGWCAYADPCASMCMWKSWCTSAAYIGQKGNNSSSHSSLYLCHNVQGVFFDSD